jgi:hypothetical protein
MPGGALNSIIDVFTNRGLKLITSILSLYSSARALEK